MSPLKREFYPSIRQIRARDRENPADQSAAANNKDASYNEIVVAYSIDQNANVRKITDLDERAAMKDTRSFEEQRDYFILNRILDRLYFDYKVWIDRDVLTQLIKRYFGVSLMYPNRLETIINERLLRLKGQRPS